VTVKAEAEMKEAEMKEVMEEKRMVVPISNLNLIPMKKLKRLMKLRPMKKQNQNLLRN
jgi:hypothetical protein